MRWASCDLLPRAEGWPVSPIPHSCLPGCGPQTLGFHWKDPWAANAPKGILHPGLPPYSRWAVETVNHTLSPSLAPGALEPGQKKKMEKVESEHVDYVNYMLTTCK